MFVICGRIRPFIAYLAAVTILATLLSGHAHATTSIQPALLTVSKAGPENQIYARQDRSHHQTASKHAPRLCCGPFCAFGWLLGSDPELAFASRVASPALWPTYLAASEIDFFDIFRPPKAISIS